MRKLAERSQTAAQQISDLAKKSVAVAENAGSLLDRTVPMIRDTSTLIQEIAAASQEQMAAIREINVGVSQLEEVVQQNAAASHQLSATASGSGLTIRDLAARGRLLPDRYIRQRLGGWNGGSGALAARGGGASAGTPGQAAPSTRSADGPFPWLRRPSWHRPGRGGPAHPAPPAALPAHPGPSACLRRPNHRAIPAPRHAAESWLTLTMMTISSDSDEGDIGS